MKNEESILNYVKEKEKVSVAEICKNLDVSESTARRKLSDLAKKGLIRRTHGGAQIIDTNNSVFNFSLRIHKNIFEKRIIALKAANLIKEGDVVFLDGSTSTYFLAEYLNEIKNITVITNGIDTLSLLAKKGVKAVSTGGKVSEENTSVLVGNYAVDFVKTVNANICFFSCQSLGKNGEISDCYIEENHVRKAMIAQSQKTVLLCDSTKLNRTSPYKLCNARDIDYIVTDKPLDDYLSEPDKCNLI